jgi:hypothetical protein
LQNRRSDGNLAHRTRCAQVHDIRIRFSMLAICVPFLGADQPHVPGPPDPFARGGARQPELAFDLFRWRQADQAGDVVDPGGHLEAFGDRASQPDQLKVRIVQSRRQDVDVGAAVAGVLAPSALDAGQYPGAGQVGDPYRAQHGAVGDRSGKDPVRGSYPTIASLVSYRGGRCGPAVTGAVQPMLPAAGLPIRLRPGLSRRPSSACTAARPGPPA